ncbi:MAG: hypothetical protein LAQ69_36020 [Acidobacteriia bacterium]|nr:hypothetical protein [Terriglobia bacterium]
MTIRKAAVLIAGAGLVAAVAAAYLRPSVAPPGQPALLTLNPANFREFEAAFDAHPDQPRLVLLFSPT